MLRTELEKEPSVKNRLVLQYNHNFFVRTAIANFAKIAIASIIYAISVTAIVNFLPISSFNYSGTIIFISSIAYLVYFLSTLSEIVTLYKKSTTIENRILGTTTSQKNPLS